MNSVVKSRGRGRGRGLAAGWLGNFKPKELSIPKPESKDKEVVISDFEDASDEVSMYFSKENVNRVYKKQTSVDEMVSQIAFDIKEEVTRQNSRDSDEKSATIQEDEAAADINNTTELQNNIADLNITTNHNPVDDEQKPAQPNIQDDLKAKYEAPVEDLKPSYDPVLLQAISAQEFVPTFTPTTFNETSFYTTQRNDVIIPEQSNRDIVMHVLHDICASLTDDPGGLEDDLPIIAEHLENFVDDESLLKEIVDFIVDKALYDSTFRYVGAQVSHYIDQNVKFDNNMSYRSLFYKRCHSEFTNVKELFKDISSQETEKKIENYSLFFGELLCNTKVKNNVNTVFRKVIFDFIDFFLATKNEYCMRTMVKLLKLVGPELDRERPKDVETMFDKVRDFYLDGERSSFLTSATKDLIWRVYKLHSRDWDRTEVAPSPTFSSVPASQTFNFAPRKSSQSSLPGTNTDRRLSNDSRESPVNWEEYHYGDDAIYSNGDYDNSSNSENNDEEFDAYEEFLRYSGQI